MKKSSLCLVLLMAACGDDGKGEGDDSLDDDIDRTTELANQRARSACGAPDDVTTSDAEGDSEAGRCYYELSFEFEPCEREALRKDPETARKALACALDEVDTEVAECCEDGRCTYSDLDACDRESLVDPTCDALWDSLEEHLSKDC